MVTSGKRIMITLSLDARFPEMRKNLTEVELSYIEEKISRLEQAAEVFKGTPIIKSGPNRPRIREGTITNA
jgi:hypothetical protein